MFALEIAFQQNGIAPETLLVRRPYAVIGASDRAHVTIDDLQGLDYELQIVRDFGRSFRIKPIPLKEDAEVPDFLEGVYHDEYRITLGSVSILITVLDTDLMFRSSEPPDQEGVRVLRAACSVSELKFPAVVVSGDDPIIVSFSADLPIYAGRSNQCAVRLDHPELSDQHARIGYEDGMFWVEDLGSSHGTFVQGQQISGKVQVPAGVPISLGHKVVLIGTMRKEDLQGASTPVPIAENTQEEARKYPVLLSYSEIARPARLVLPVDTPVTVGRDPRSEMWLGAPHISRTHCQVTLQSDGQVVVTDCSTNGTAYDGGILKKGQLLELHDEPNVLNFGGDITVGICFHEWHEEDFMTNHGAPDTFSRGKSDAGGKAGSGNLTSLSRESISEAVSPRARTYSGTMEAMGVDWSGTVGGGGTAALDFKSPSLAADESMVTFIGRSAHAFSDFPLPTRILLGVALCILAGVCMALLQLLWSIFH